MKDQDYGKGYKYAHSYPNNFITQEFLPKEIAGTKIYDPGENARENEMRKRLQMLWKEKYGY
jgi:putative ATPase